MSKILQTGYMTEAGNCVTPEARASWCYVHAPQEPDKKNGLKAAKYSITLLFTADSDLALLKAEAMRAATEKWGADPAKWPKKHPDDATHCLRLPFRDQGEKAYEGYVKGLKFITASATLKSPPEVLGPTGKPIPPSESRLLYSGCWVRCSVRAFAYDEAGNKGISFALNNVQKIRDDTPFSGRPPASSEFAPIEGATAATGDAASIFD